MEKASRYFAKQMQSTPIKIAVLRIGLSPEQLKEYDHVMKYQLGKRIELLRKLTFLEKAEERKNYHLPLRYVIRTEKKLCVVYELAHPDFTDTLIRFRVHPVAVFGDIAKA